MAAADEDDVPAFADLGVLDHLFEALGDKPAADTAPPAPLEPLPEPVAAPPRPLSGEAFITVTDAAGRVLFRRRATDAEISDALTSAEAADREGQSAMDRIAHDRLSAELADFKGEPRL